METQKIANFLETAVEREFVCDDVVFAMSEEHRLTAVENTIIEHINEVEE